MKKEKELYDINIQKEYFNGIEEITEEFLSYMDSYKSLTKDYEKNLKKVEKLFEEKMKISKIQFENNKHLDLSYIFNIVNSIPKINGAYLEYLSYLNRGMETSITSLKKYLEEKKYMIIKFLDNLNDSKNDLIIKINDIEKEKNIYFNNLAKTENTISEFFINKIKIENYSKNINNQNTTEIKNLFIDNSNLEEKMNKSINESQKLEKNYNFVLSCSNVFKKAYIDSSNIAYENIRNISCELFIEIKKFIQNIIILQKNCYIIPLKEIDSNLSKLILKKEEDEKILNKLFPNTDIKIEDKFQIVAKKYSLQTFKNNIDNFTQKPFLIIEDGLEEINYIENDLEFYTAKTMFSSFSLIDDKYKINFKEEEEKRNTKKIISNLLLNIEKKNKKANDNELHFIHENDINHLYSLLDKHYNKVVFMQTISEFRNSGKYLLPLKVFDIIGKCLIIIIDTILRDEDYHCAKNAIILSQTYFRIKDDKRFYLHNLIKKNKLFYNLDFWRKIIDISIKHEIIKSQKISKNINKIQNKDNIKNENKKDDELNLDLSNEKYNDIAFGQIASIVNSMIDFNINIKDIRNIIEPKFEFYKLNTIQKNNIELVIDNKLNSNNIEESKENIEKMENKENKENKEHNENIDNIEDNFIKNEKIKIDNKIINKEHE